MLSQSPEFGTSYVLGDDRSRWRATENRTRAADPLATAGNQAGVEAAALR